MSHNGKMADGFIGELEFCRNINTGKCAADFKLLGKAEHG